MTCRKRELLYFNVQVEHLSGLWLWAECSNNGGMVGVHSFKYHNNPSLTLRPTMSSRAVWVFIFPESYLLAFPSRCGGPLTVPSLPASVFITQLLCVLHLAAYMDTCNFLQNITYGWLGRLTQRCWEVSVSPTPRQQTTVRGKGGMTFHPLHPKTHSSKVRGDISWDHILA